MMLETRKKITIRNWLLERSPEAAFLLETFDRECHEVICVCCSQDILENGPLRLVTKTHQLFWHDKEIKPSRKQFAIIEHLLRNKGRYVTYEEILTKIWGEDFKRKLPYIRVHLRDIRNMLGKDSNFIKTISGVGLIMEELR